MLIRRLTTLLAAASAGFAAPAAFAHHVGGGMMPTTLTDGVLSGLAHPVIGLDHFAFIVGIGLVAGLAGLGLRLPLMFVTAMTAGVMLHLTGLTAPRIELLVALSVVLIGIAVAVREGHAWSWREGAAFGAAGIIHGYAFAESIVGAETGPIAGYLAGLAVAQMVIAGTAWYLARLEPGMLRRRLGSGAMKIAGASIAVIGAYHMLAA